MVHLRREEGVSPVSNFSWSRSKRVWRNVFGKFLANIHKDIAWMAAHQCLPTRDFQHRRGLVARAKCPRDSCREDETVLHLFWNCCFAQELWGRLGILLKWVCGLKDFSYEYVLYGLFNCPTTHQFKVCWCIINCAKNAIWKARNILLFNRDFISVNDCIKLAFSEMFIYFLKDVKDVGKKEANRRWELEMELALSTPRIDPLLQSLREQCTPSLIRIYRQSIAMNFVKNTIRLTVDPSNGAKNNVVFIIRDLIEEKAGAKRTEIFSCNEFPRQGNYDVTFVDQNVCLNVFEWLRAMLRILFWKELAGYHCLGYKKKRQSVLKDSVAEIAGKRGMLLTNVLRLKPVMSVGVVHICTRTVPIVHPDGPTKSKWRKSWPGGERARIVKEVARRFEREEEERREAECECE
ncbi:unnamed protein product [Ranitomeya imitator]|uniref:Reverse transcriptase zinc-binding domain-containing protein n=1 Tax=Ranitomeya imitator TaxID=111125 RepID=A0ABN9LC49_9NEOB|nr:unnamed protein product [Ranitomeya imitator]